MTVYQLTYSDQFTDFVMIGLFQSVESAKTRAEAHWNNRDNRVLRWSMSNGGFDVGVPVNTGLIKRDYITYASYSIQPFEVE